MNINSIGKPLLIFSTLSGVALIAIGAFAYNQFGLFKDMPHGPGIMMLGIGGGLLIAEGILLYCKKPKAIIQNCIQKIDSQYVLVLENGKTYPFVLADSSLAETYFDELKSNEFLLTYLIKGDKEIFTIHFSDGSELEINSVGKIKIPDSHVADLKTKENGGPRILALMQKRAMQEKILSDNS